MPNKAKDTVVETQAEETAACCSCGTHGRKMVIVHLVIGAIALFMLCSLLVVGAVVKVVGSHGDKGRGGRGGAVCEQCIQGRGGIGNKGPGMMQQGGGYGRGMMNGGQGYYYGQPGVTEDSTVPDTQEEVPAPVTPQGSATQ